MGLWKGAWRLASFELRTSWGGVLLTLLFFAYMALIGSQLINEVFSGDLPHGVEWAPDFMLLTVLPNTLREPRLLNGFASGI
ncbi:MAG TPA: hypothetical protein VMS09_05580 [Paenibacillus sp.]|nr:hypothetical protein [Paenibacillus sp.]